MITNLKNLDKYIIFLDFHTFHKCIKKFYNLSQKGGIYFFLLHNYTKVLIVKF